MKRFLPLIIFITSCTMFFSLIRIVPDIFILNDIKNCGKAASDVDKNEIERINVTQVKNKKDIMFVCDVLKYANFRRPMLYRESPPDFIEFELDIGDIQLIHSGKSGNWTTTYHNKQYYIILSEKAEKELFNHFGYYPAE